MYKEAIPVKLVLGDNIHMHEVVNMASKALIMWFLGERMGEHLLKFWVKDTWEPILGYMSKFSFWFVDGWVSYFSQRRMSIKL
jgi:hypothetical protein